MGLIATRLKQVREKADLKKIELAKKANISHSYLSEIESGAKEPPFKTLQKICLALDVSLAEFFADDNQFICNMPLTKMGRLCETLARADGLPNDDIDAIVAIMEVLIDCFKKTEHTKKHLHYFESHFENDGGG